MGETSMDLLATVREFLGARGVKAYLVGGTVRDALLARERHDLDLAVVGETAPLARAFADALGAVFYLMDAEFDVARVIVKGEPDEIVDFVRMRGETIESDLATRDFTINAMAADAATWRGDATEVIDPFNGRADLAARRVRVVSDRVFIHDAVRLLRAVRLQAELGFELDEHTQVLMRRAARRLTTAPQERVRDEFMRILVADNVLRQLQWLNELGLLTRVFPELRPTRGMEQSPPHLYDVLTHSLHAVAAFEQLERGEFTEIAQGAFAERLRTHFAERVSAERTRGMLLRVTLLLHDVGKPVVRTQDADGRYRFWGHEVVGAAWADTALRRVRFSNDEIALCTTVIRHHLRPILLAKDSLTDRAVYRFFRATGQAGVDTAIHAWCDQRATYGANMPPETEAALQAVIARLLDRYYHAHARVVAPPPLVSGTDLMHALQVKPGPYLGALLDAIREAQAAGEVSTRDEALEFVRKLIASGESKGCLIPRGRAESHRD